MEADLNRYLQVCGCGVASVAAVAFVGMLAYAHLVAGMGIPVAAPWLLASGIVAAAVVGAIAKLSAIYLTKWRMTVLYQSEPYRV
jgi:hypothetical protein